MLSSFRGGRALAENENEEKVSLFACDPRDAHRYEKHQSFWSTRWSSVCKASIVLIDLYLSSKSIRTVSGMGSSWWQACLCSEVKWYKAGSEGEGERGKKITFLPLGFLRFLILPTSHSLYRTKQSNTSNERTADRCAKNFVVSLSCGGHSCTLILHNSLWLAPVGMPMLWTHIHVEIYMYKVLEVV